MQDYLEAKAKYEASKDPDEFDLFRFMCDPRKLYGGEGIGRYPIRYP